MAADPDGRVHGGFWYPHFVVHDDWIHWSCADDSPRAAGYHRSPDDNRRCMPGCGSGYLDANNLGNPHGNGDSSKQHFPNRHPLTYRNLGTNFHQHTDGNGTSSRRDPNGHRDSHRASTCCNVDLDKIRDCFPNSNQDRAADSCSDPDRIPVPEPAGRCDPQGYPQGFREWISYFGLLGQKGRAGPLFIPFVDRVLWTWMSELDGKMAWKEEECSLALERQRWLTKEFIDSCQP